MGKASYAETVTLPTAERGDTFSGYEITLTVNGSAKDLTDAVITLTLAGGYGELRTGNGITIITPASGVFQIDKQVINFAAKTHEYEIKFEFADGDIKTYIEGTWRITS